MDFYLDFWSIVQPKICITATKQGDTLGQHNI